MIVDEPVYEGLSIEKRFELLKQYMEKKIDGKITGSFATFVKNYKARYCEESIRFAKKHATKCFYCNTKLSRWNNSLTQATVDHFYSCWFTALGSQMVVCCRKCNQAKGSLHPREFQRRLRLTLMGQDFYPQYKEREIKRIINVIDTIFNNPGRQVFYTWDPTKQRR